MVKSQIYEILVISMSSPHLVLIFSTLFYVQSQSFFMLNVRRAFPATANPLQQTNKLHDHIHGTECKQRADNELHTSSCPQSDESGDDTAATTVVNIYVQQ